MPDWVETAYRDDAARMPHECRLELVEIAPAQRGKNADLVRAKQQEGEKILKALPRDALVIALDEHGRQHGSVEWAGELKDWMQSGRDTCLLIGGPDGHSPEVLAQIGREAWRERGGQCGE